MNGFITYNSIRQSLSQHRKNVVDAGLSDPFENKGSFNATNKQLYEQLKSLPPKEQKEFKNLESKDKSKRLRSGLLFIENKIQFVDVGNEAYRLAIETLENSDRNYWNLQEMINDTVVETAGVDITYADTQRITVINKDIFPEEIRDELYDFEDYTLKQLANMLNGEIVSDKDDQNGSRLYHDTVNRINKFVRNEEGREYFGGSGYLIYEVEGNEAGIVLYLRSVIDQPVWVSEKEREPATLEEKEIVEKKAQIPSPIDKRKQEIETEILQEELKLIKAQTENTLRTFKRKAFLEEKTELEKEIDRLEVKVDRYEKKGNDRMVKKYEDRIDGYEDRIDEIMKQLKT